MQRRLQVELDEGKLVAGDGSFNTNRYREILEEYGLRPKLRVVESVASTADGQLPPKPKNIKSEIKEVYFDILS